MYWYQCNKCSTTIKSETFPISNKCAKAPSHSWNKLGEVGDNNYHCSKCSTTIQTKSTPISCICPNAASHSWKKI